MSTERFEELLDPWARNELDAAEAVEFDALLERHPEWREEADTHREMLELIQSAPAPKAPAGLLAGALAKARAQGFAPDSEPLPGEEPAAAPPAKVIEVATPPPSERRATKRGLVFPMRWMAVAATVAVVVATGTYMTLQNKEEFHPPKSQLAGQDIALAEQNIHAPAKSDQKQVLATESEIDALASPPEMEMLATNTPEKLARVAAEPLKETGEGTEDLFIADVEAESPAEETMTLAAAIQPAPTPAPSRPKAEAAPKPASQTASGTSYTMKNPFASGDSPFAGESDDTSNAFMSMPPQPDDHNPSQNAEDPSSSSASEPFAATLAEAPADKTNWNFDAPSLSAADSLDANNSGLIDTVREERKDAELAMRNRPNRQTQPEWNRSVPEWYTDGDEAKKTSPRVHGFTDTPLTAPGTADNRVSELRDDARENALAMAKSSNDALEKAKNELSEAAEAFEKRTLYYESPAPAADIVMASLPIPNDEYAFMQQQAQSVGGVQSTASGGRTKDKGQTYDPTNGTISRGDIVNYSDLASDSSRQIAQASTADEFVVEFANQQALDSFLWRLKVVPIRVDRSTSTTAPRYEAQQPTRARQTPVFNALVGGGKNTARRQPSTSADIETLNLDHYTMEIVPDERTGRIRLILRVRQDNRVAPTPMGTEKPADTRGVIRRY